MGQSEQHEIMKLTRRIESLEAKVYGGEKEYWDDVLSSKYIFGPEKPELKLNEEWQNHPQYMYAEGAKDMQKAIYYRALEVYDAHEGRISWATACAEAIEEMKQCKIKPPTK